MHVKITCLAFVKTNLLTIQKREFLSRQHPELQEVICYIRDVYLSNISRPILI